MYLSYIVLLLIINLRSPIVTKSHISTQWCYFFVDVILTAFNPAYCYLPLDRFHITYERKYVWTSSVQFVPPGTARLPHILEYTFRVTVSNQRERKNYIYLIFFTKCFRKLDIHVCINTHM